VIVLPSLSERRGDIPLLLKSFLSDLAKQYKREIPEVDREVFEYLMERSWPGNIRELRHVVERAFVFCENGRLRVSNFGAGNSQAAPHVPEGPDTDATIRQGSLKEKLDQVERDMMAEALLRFKGNKKKAAEFLGVSRTYLYKRLGE
jgi:DNA-binding NtrC family response regulator